MGRELANVEDLRNHLGDKKVDFVSRHTEIATDEFKCMVPK
jgi:hypothetical protein